MTIFWIISDIIQLISLTNESIESFTRLRFWRTIQQKCTEDNHNT